MKIWIIIFSILFHFCFTYSAIAIQLVHQSYFEFGNSNIDNKEAELLVSNLKGITSNTTLWIIGYSDEAGSDSQNIILSQKRAENIKNLILKKTELNAYQIKAMANGTDRSNISSVLKRRTEIFVLNDSANIISEKVKSQNGIVKRNLALQSKEEDKEKRKNINSDQHENLTLNEANKLSNSINELKSSIDLLNKNLENKKRDNIQEHVLTTKKEVENIEPILSEQKSKSADSSLIKILKKTSYEMDINYFLADQNANLDPVIENNDLLSDPRLAVNLRTETLLNKNLSLINNIGVSWNEYSDEISSGLEDSWKGFAFSFSTGLKKSINQKISHSLNVGFEQILNHDLFTPTSYKVSLEPILNLSYGLYFNILETKNFNFKISPDLGLIWGLDQVDQGFSYGLNFKSYFGNNKNYYINTGYNKNLYKINDIKFKIESLELGFGIKF